MELKYSKKGIPFIELDTKNKLVFSATTANKKGYKWIMFSGVSTTTETISSGKGAKKKKSKIKMTMPISTLIDMGFSTVSKSAKNANPFLSKRHLDGMRRMFEPYVVNGIFPYENVSKFADYINNDSVVTKEDLLEDDPMGYYEDDEDDE